MKFEEKLQILSICIDESYYKIQNIRHTSKIDMIMLNFQRKKCVKYNNQSCIEER